MKVSIPVKYIVPDLEKSAAITIGRAPRCFVLFSFSFPRSF